MEQLLSTRRAGQRLGGLHPNDVRRLARLGLLKGKYMVVRGGNKKPRMYIIESSIAQYISGLPDAKPTGAEAAPAERKAKVRKCIRRHVMDGVIEVV